jgi:ABC-type branched-subunit amino acid transport system substrate-binding protein
MSPYVAQALSQGAQCLYISAFGSDAVSLLEAAAQASPTVKLMTSPGYITPAAIQSLGPAIMNRLIGDAGSYPVTSAAKHPALKTFMAQLKKYAPSPTLEDAASVTAWSEADALITAIRQVKGSITSAKVIQQLNTFKNYNVGVGPAVSVNKPDPASGYPRVFAPNALEVKWVNNQVTQVGQFFNFFTGKTVK